MRSTVERIKRETIHLLKCAIPKGLNFLLVHICWKLLHIIRWEKRSEEVKRKCYGYIIQYNGERFDTQATGRSFKSFQQTILCHDIIRFAFVSFIINFLSPVYLDQSRKFSVLADEFVYIWWHSYVLSWFSKQISSYKHKTISTFSLHVIILTRIN